MATTKGKAKQNVTICLDRKTIQSAKMIPARRSTSLSSLLASQIERLVGEEVTYEDATGRAMALRDQGFRWGGKIRPQTGRSAIRLLPLPPKMPDQKSSPACDLHSALLIEYNTSR